jgi:hypothetical protein
VFVHGLLSDGEVCWTHKNGTYWPALLKDVKELQALGIYVFSYQTSVFSGSYSLSDVVDALKELLRLDGVTESRRIVFVCHSMGGIAVRKYIVERSIDLIERNTSLCLFLVASPSLGALYANWLSPLVQALGHAQADALRFQQSNTWLNGLDKEFQNIKESGKISIRGKELVEDKFVVLKRLLQKQVVEPFAGARYFGEPFKVPLSDHFTIAKPNSANAIQHRLLCQFIKDSIGAGSKSSTGAGTPPPAAATNSEAVVADLLMVSRSVGKNPARLFVGVTVRNLSTRAAFVENWGIKWPSGRSNADFGAHNPPLPCRIEPGESKTWEMDATGLFQDNDNKGTCVGYADLGTGERLFTRTKGWCPGRL